MHAYRADIDGLRAVAIMPVVLFHAGVPGFSGGFVGVDVFFVISGFLITQFLLNDLDRGRYSVVGFYERRIRRIFPALFAMLGCTTVAACWLLLPHDLVAFARSALATALFYSNVEFWQASGYFAAAADEMPLLHTWSLAVEEQFYIVFPLFLAACHRGGRRRMVVLTAVVTIASFLLSVWSVARDRDLAFYLPHTRAWELGLGALLALRVPPALATVTARNVAGLFGLAAIGGAVFGYTAATPFPGLAALLPCVGTGLVIWAGSGAHARHLVGDALARRPFVRTGLVSYSLYLWHWPLLAFAGYVSLGDPSPTLRAGAVIAAIACAMASWRWIERPFRGRSGWLDRRGAFRAAGAAMLTVVVLGLGMTAGGGWPWRLSPDVRALAAGRDDAPPLDSPCFNATPEMVANRALCRSGDVTRPATYLVWGDSHARALAPAIDAIARNAGRGGLIASRSSCAPLPGVRRADHGPRRRCEEFSRAVLQFGLADPSLTDVIVIGRWGLLAEGEHYGHEPAEVVRMRDAQSRESSPAENRRVLERSLGSAVQAMRAAGKRVWIVGPVPEVGRPVPGTLARGLRFHHAIDLAPARADFDARQRNAWNVLARVAATYGATLVSMHPWLCDARRCEVVGTDGRPLYFDDDHLSYAGARRVAPAFTPVFADVQ